MILTPEEQLEYREEIDYLIESRGYEYVWGLESAMDKTKGLLRDAPGKVIDGINRIVTNPAVININEKLKAHAEKINAQDAQQMRGPHNPLPSRRQSKRKSLYNGRERTNHVDGFRFGDDHL